MSNLNKMLKQAQKMQKDVEKAQNDLARMEISYTNNGIEVVARGDNTIKSISIDDDLVNAQDKEMLQDLVLVAVNGALTRIRDKTESKLSGITSGLDLSGLM